MRESARRRAARAALEGYGEDVADAWARAVGASRTRTLAARNTWRGWARQAGAPCARAALEGRTPVWALGEEAQGIAALRRHTVMKSLEAVSLAVEDEISEEPIPPGETDADVWLEGLEAAEERAEAALWAAAGGKRAIPPRRERARAAALAAAAGTDEGSSWTLSDAAVRALASLSDGAARRVEGLGGWRTRTVCESGAQIALEAEDDAGAVRAAIATQGGATRAINAGEAQAMDASLSTWRWDAMKPPVRTLWALAQTGRVIDDEPGWGAALVLERERGEESAPRRAQRWEAHSADLLRGMEEAIQAIAVDRLTAMTVGLQSAPRSAATRALERLDGLWRGTGRARAARPRLDADPVSALSMVWVVATDSAARVLGLSPEGENSRSARLMRAIRKHAGRKIEVARPEALTAAGPVPRRAGEEAEGEEAARRWREAVAALKRAGLTQGGV